MNLSSLTFNGNGETTCKCCEKKISSKSNMYDGVCSFECSSKLLEYNAIPINLLFIRRTFIHIRDFSLREKEIEKFIVSNKLNMIMAKHKIERVANLIMNNHLDKLTIRNNMVFIIDNDTKSVLQKKRKKRINIL